MADEVAGFAARLKAARQVAGWSASELARRAGVEPRTVQYLETGSSEPTLRTAQLLALALGVSLLDLCPEVQLPA